LVGYNQIMESKQLSSEKSDWIYRITAGILTANLIAASVIWGNLFLPRFKYFGLSTEIYVYLLLTVSLLVLLLFLTNIVFFSWLFWALLLSRNTNLHLSIGRILKSKGLLCWIIGSIAFYLPLSFITLYFIAWLVRPWSSEF
jgi:hypothetical protein